MATTPELRPDLAAHADLLGPVQQTFRLLGVRYKFGPDLADAATTSNFERRSQRIARVTYKLWMRRLLVNALLVTLVSWAGPWQRPATTHLKTWTRACERALWAGRPAPARSPLLAWFVLGDAWCHPEFALAFSAARSTYTHCSVYDVEVGLDATA